MKKYQVQLLVVASLVFYSYESPWFLLLLLASAFINIFVSYFVVHTDSLSRRKVLAIIGVVLNLSILAFFKYAKLITLTFIGADGSVGEFLINIPLPIGISFFTFEGISLVVDVYKGADASKYRSLVPKMISQHTKNVLLFIAFFPHLIAGPILKAHDFIPQIGRKHFNAIRWNYCFEHLVTGFFLKMVIADNLKDFTFWLQYPYFEAFSSFTLIILLLGYSAQIFADFAGYSLIALGLAGLFGYQLEQNFNFPYIARSFSEFWRRWHISLSTFLKEYLYIPLGGNRKGNARTYINLMITMFLGGLWHGAAWSYAVWGCFHGLALAIERFLQGFVRLPKGRITDLFSMVLVFSLVSLAWLLFKLPEFSHVIYYFRAFLNNHYLLADHTLVFNILLLSTPVFLYHVLYLLKEKGSWNLTKPVLRPYWYGLMLFLLISNSGSTGSFIYFQF